MKNLFAASKIMFYGMIMAFIFAMWAGPAGAMLGFIVGAILSQVAHFQIGVAGFLNLKELRDQKAAKMDAMKSIIENAKKEGRNLRGDELVNYNNLKKEIEDINGNIVVAEDEEKRAIEEAKKQGKISKKEKMDLQKFSFLRALDMARTGKLDGLEGEMHAEGEKEAREIGISLQGGVVIPQMILSHREQRAVTATGQTSIAGDQGGVAIATELRGFIDYLNDALVLRQLGADFATGLVGNLDFPKEATVASATWEGENDDNAESSPTFGKLSASPKRLGTFIDVSKQLLLQTSPSIEARIRRQLVNAIAIALESAAISGSGSDPIPEGILSTTGIGSVAGGPDGSAPTWDDLVALEREVGIDNALLGMLGYLTNTKVKAKLKTTKIDEGSGLFVWPQGANELNGYRVGVTNLVPSNLSKGSSSEILSAIIFGNWNDLFIGQWGGIEVLPNPYTKAKAGLIEMIVNTYADVLVLRPQSFAAKVDVQTA